MNDEVHAGLGPLSVIGTAAPLHRNDDVANYFEEGNHLINHEERAATVLNTYDDYEDSDNMFYTHEGVLLMDRYDGRSLLQDYEEYCAVPDTSKKKDNNPIVYLGDDEENNDIMQELIVERFGALPEYLEWFCGQQDPSSITNQPTTTTTEEDINDQASHEETFIFPIEDRVHVPDGIILPQTNRQYQVICMAAEKNVATPQFEVLLKVKQSSNQEFTFLQEGDALHPFYVHLKKKQQRKKEQKLIPTEVQKTDSTTGSRLLVEYDSSSSDEVNSTVNNRKEVGHPLLACYSSSDDEEPPDIKTIVDDNTNVVLSEKNSVSTIELSTKERRLKRARLLRDHFSLKMMDNVQHK